MGDRDQNQTSRHQSILDCHGFEKILVLLQGLRKSPSGLVFYQQIERLVREAENTQSKIIRGYAALVLTLIETYRRQLPRDSRLYLELMVVQKRLTPPISLTELTGLEIYLKNVAKILARVGNVEEEVLREALAPLLDEAQPAEHTSPGADHASPGAEPAPGPQHEARTGRPPAIPASSSRSHRLTGAGWISSGRTWNGCKRRWRTRSTRRASSKKGLRPCSIPS